MLKVVGIIAGVIASVAIGLALGAFVLVVLADAEAVRPIAEVEVAEITLTKAEEAPAPVAPAVEPEIAPEPEPSPAYCPGTDAPVDLDQADRGCSPEDLGIPEEYATEYDTEENRDTICGLYEDSVSYKEYLECLELW